MSLHQIKKISVTDQVLFQLEREILWGAWKPGVQIPSEITISKILQVSRSSVAAALDLLRRRQVLITLPGKGTFVSQEPDLISFQMTGMMMPDETALLSCIIEFLQLVLVPATQLAVEKSSSLTFKNLERLYRKMQGSIEASDLFSQYDKLFYREIMVCAANPLLLRVFETLDPFLSGTLNVLDQLSDKDQRLLQRQLLLKCFEIKDALRARILMNQECHYFYMLLSEANHD